ncbi:MAG: class I SAM-dependent methyltransferase [Pseudomonadota bacterium]
MAAYLDIVRHYERCLEQHGAGAEAVDWKDETSARIRYGVMHGLFAHERERVRVLDFGCGLCAFKDHLDDQGVDVAFEGLDLSPAFADAARARHRDVPVHCLDILDGTDGLPTFDYIIMNGIFTRRETLKEGDMMEYLVRLTRAAWGLTSRGLAFNVMSDAVDWKSDTLFHPDMAALARAVTENLSRHFTLRSDYGLYETTVYVYAQPKTEAS